MDGTNMAVSAAMKELIDKLIAKCDNSVTEAGRRVDTSHQNLRNWQEMEAKAKDVHRFLEVAERIFDVLEIPPSKRWKYLRNVKEEK
jgi:hypothetical protein